MARDRIVSVRLTEAEYAELTRHGSPSVLLRRALRTLLDLPPVPSSEGLPLATTAARAHVMWDDGTCGQTYPALATG